MPESYLPGVPSNIFRGEEKQISLAFLQKLPQHLSVLVGPDKIPFPYIPLQGGEFGSRTLPTSSCLRQISKPT